MSRAENIVIAVLCMALVLAISVLTMLPTIHRWERDNGYPYGKMCEVFHNCR